MKKTFRKFRSFLLVFLTHQLALPLLKLLRKPVVFPFTLEELLIFPAGSLGRDLAVFLQSRNLQLLPYYAKHDIKHILLGYDTTDEGEVCLQCFMLGNRHWSFPVLATVVFGWLTMPEHWRKFSKAFQRGRRNTAIEGWSWFALLPQDTTVLQLKIKP
jgi:ubiquinone biosynthesis protein Coq4